MMAIFNLISSYHFSLCFFLSIRSALVKIASSVRVNWFNNQSLIEAKNGFLPVFVQLFFYCSLNKIFMKGSWLVSTAIQLNSHGDVVVP